MNSNRSAFDIYTTQEEREQAWQIACEQDAEKRKNLSRHDNRMLDKDWKDIAKIGITGELVFSRLTGAEPKFDYHCGGDLGWDFTMNGLKIELKTLKSGMPLALMKFEWTADAYVLFHYFDENLTKLSVQGWIPAKLFKRDYEVRNFGYGDRPTINAERLFPFDTLSLYSYMVSPAWVWKDE